jgi:hypothetical protein
MYDEYIKYYMYALNIYMCMFYLVLVVKINKINKGEKMDIQQLKELYDDMAKNVESYEAIFKAFRRFNTLVGPEPGICLDGQKGEWREYTQDEINQIRAGNIEMITDYTIKRVFIGDQRKPEDIAKDSISGEGDFRDLNEIELRSFKDIVCPVFGSMAQLIKYGLMKFEYFDDEGNSMDNYSINEEFLQNFIVDKTHKRLQGLYIQGTLFLGKHVSVSDDIITIYQMLATNPFERTPNQENLKKIDRIVATCYDNKQSK